MRLRDVMTSDLPVIEPGESVRDAARAMTLHGVKAIPVLEGGRLIGIVTDWDVTAAAADHDDLDRVPVREAMSADVIVAEPGWTLDEASELMGEHRLHHLCVSDRDGGFHGLVHLDVEWAQLGGLGAQAPQATFMAPV